ncbi:hypothetical protein BN189_340011 [Clostridioides difficile T10]|nr:hypothetical protein BN172_5040007 [Clostridioides difficile T15]CCL88681.1 hypothetical protein BN189_340011 [Clostridioides difficile T10]
MGFCFHYIIFLSFFQRSPHFIEASSTDIHSIIKSTFEYYFTISL